MSKFLNYTIWICVAILLVVNVFFIYHARVNKYSDEMGQTEQATDLIKFKNLEKEMKAIFSNEYQYLPSELIIDDIKGNKHELTEIIKENTFVLWYPQHNCSLCFQNSLDQFLDLAHQGRKAIILSTKLGVRDLYFFKKKYNIDVPCYVVKDYSPSYPFKDSTVPLFFNLSNNMQISNVWIHNAKFDEIADEYFKMQERLILSSSLPD